MIVLDLKVCDMRRVGKGWCCHISWKLGGGPFYFQFWYLTVSNFTCTDGEIKLIGGTAAYGGTIQVCMNNRFGTICDDKFNSVAAGVVCNSLGYPRQGKCMMCLQAPE